MMYYIIILLEKIMQRIIVPEKSLLSYPTLKDAVHHESDIYLADDKTLYKILTYSNRLLREQIIERLGNYENPNCVLPNSIIFNENRDFIGYSMDYLSNHYLSTKLIFSTEEYKKRLKLALKIVKTIQSFKNDGFVFWDIHPDNVMIRDYDVKIIDMDSIRHRDDYETDNYREEQKSSHQLLMQLSLSYISSMDVLMLGKALDESILKECFSKAFRGQELSRVLDSTFGYPSELIMPSEYIEMIDENDLKNCRSKLIRRLTK